MDDAKACMGASCGGLKTQAVSVGNSCKVPNRVKEDYDSWLTELPGVAMPMNMDA
jgi:hypothetical protein